MERGTIIDQFMYCINSYREAAMSNDPKFDHIDIAEKQKVILVNFHLFFPSFIPIESNMVFPFLSRY